MATKAQIKVNLGKLHEKLKKLLQKETMADFTYSGDDDDFSDGICHLFGDLSNILSDIEELRD